MSSAAEPTHPKVSRRVLLSAAAWTAPAIVIAQSTPARAASDDVVVDTFSVIGQCYARTARGVAFEFRIRWTFALGASGLPAGTAVIIQTTGSAYNHSYQISGGTITQSGNSVDSGGVRTSTYLLTATTYSLTDIITDFYKAASIGGVPWTCSMSIILPSGYVAAPGSVGYGEVGETAQNQLVCA